MKSTIQNILQNYEKIEPNDHVGRVKFYEENSSLISLLTLEKQYKLRYAFVKSLFDIGQYEKVLLEIDDVIEYVFLHDVNYDHNSFHELIFIKAASYLDLHQYNKAIQVAKELVKMSPENKLYRQLLLTGYFKKSKRQHSSLRLVFLISIMVALLISILIVLKVNHQSYFNLVLLINSMVVVGFGLTYVISWWIANRQLSTVMKDIKSRKSDSKDFLLENEK